MQWCISTYIDPRDYSYGVVKKNMINEDHNPKTELHDMARDEVKIVSKQRSVPKWFFEVKDLSTDEVLNYANEHEI